MFIGHGDSNIFLKSYIYLHKLYERDVKFLNKFILPLSNKEMIKINVVDLEKLYNFVVKNFLIWIRLGLQNSIWNFICRVLFWNSAKKIFTECQRKTLGKAFFAECQKTLGKEFLKFKKFKYSFCMTIWFQNKKLSTTKFHHFLRSTMFI